MPLPILRVHIKRKISERLINDAYAMFFLLLFFVISFIKAYVVDTHSNCFDKSMHSDGYLQHTSL